MVLPGAVHFPNTVLPLRIFESRYRAMLDWALERDRMFCVALMKPGISEAKTEDGFFHTAGLGLVAASVIQPDGTSNLMLQGLARVRFTGFTQRTPFRIATIERVPETAGPISEASVLRETLREQCRAIRIQETPLPEAFHDVFDQIADPAVLADTVANALISDSMQRQFLLELTDDVVRLRELSLMLAGDFRGEGGL